MKMNVSGIRNQRLNGHLLICTTRNVYNYFLIEDRILFSVRLVYREI